MLTKVLPDVEGMILLEIKQMPQFFTFAFESLTLVSYARVLLGFEQFKAFVLAERIKERKQEGKKLPQQINQSCDNTKPNIIYIQHTVTATFGQ